MATGKGGRSIFKEKESIQVSHNVGDGGQWEEVSIGAKVKDKWSFFNTEGSDVSQATYWGGRGGQRDAQPSLQFLNGMVRIFLVKKINKQAKKFLVETQ